MDLNPSINFRLYPDPYETTTDLLDIMFVKAPNPAGGEGGEGEGRVQGADREAGGQGEYLLSTSTSGDDGAQSQGSGIRWSSGF